MLKIAPRRNGRSRLQREVRAADRLHARTVARVRDLEQENKVLKAQLLATAIDLVRARHVLRAIQGGASARVANQRREGA